MTPVEKSMRRSKGYGDIVRDPKTKKDRRVKSRISICQNCKKEYHPLQGRISKYCSYKCMGEANRKDPPKKNCLACGKSFVPWRSTAKYCSFKCKGIGMSAEHPVGSKTKNSERRNAAGKTDYLDNLWRYAIYSAADYACEFCGKKPINLNAHHVFSRSNHQVRWDLDNGVCLCVAHHVFGNQSFHKAPAEMIEWLKQKRGAEWYDRLLSKYRTTMSTKEAKEMYHPILKPYDAIFRKGLRRND